MGSRIARWIVAAVGVLIILILLLPGANDDPIPDHCFMDAGERAMFGSAEQITFLQERIDGLANCDAIAIAWRLEALPGRQSVLVWDTEERELFRVHDDQTATPSSSDTWERWQDVTAEGIEALDPGGIGWDFPKYSDMQRGSLPLSARIRDFVLAHVRVQI